MPNKLGGHKDRAHAQWSASATERNWLCPGNIALGVDTLKPPESKAAAWGTACHEVAEKLLNGEEVELGFRIETERFVFFVDTEMLETANRYVGYIRKRQDEGWDIYAVEQNFDLARLGLGMDAGGTADCVLYNANEEAVEIVDLKTGKGKLVEAVGNPQERFYALGVLVGMDMDPTPVSTVITTIVQPRAEHRDGTIRSEELHLAALMDWVIDLDHKVRTAAAALKLYQDAAGSQIKLESWVDTYLNPGETQCLFCPVSGSCPALRRDALAVAGAYRDDAGVHFKSNRFTENSIEGVEADLDMLDALETWIRERRALAHEMASMGLAFDHWHLVERIGHRKFTLPENELVAAIREEIPISDEQLYDKKLKSPAGLERSIGKAAVATYVGQYITKPVIGTDLIRSSNTDRTPSQTLVDRFFIDPVEPMEVSDGPGE